MQTSYDIWKTSEPPYYEVVVVCSECGQKPKSCECVECEDCEELEENCTCHRTELVGILKRMGTPNDC